MSGEATTSPERAMSSFIAKELDFTSGDTSIVGVCVSHLHRCAAPLFNQLLRSCCVTARVLRTLTILS